MYKYAIDCLEQTLLYLRFDLGIDKEKAELSAAIKLLQESEEK